MNIIDFHCHPFLNDFENSCFFKDTIKNKSNDIITDMQAVGISHFCGSVINSVINPPEFTGFDMLHQANKDALLLREKFGDMYIPGFHISPQFVEESVCEIEFAHENNIKLIGELVPYLHGGYSYYSGEFSILLNEIAKYNMIVSLHRMDLELLKKTALKHKDVTFVFAHINETDCEQYRDIMKQCDNVYVDISGAGTIRSGLVTWLCRSVGADRILFGSDYPIVYPSVFVEIVMREKISDNEKEKILSLNARKLLDI